MDAKQFDTLWAAITEAKVNFAYNPSPSGHAHDLIGCWFWMHNQPERAKWFWTQYDQTTNPEALDEAIQIADRYGWDNFDVFRMWCHLGGVDIDSPIISFQPDMDLYECVFVIVSRPRTPINGFDHKYIWMQHHEHSGNSA